MKAEQAMTARLRIWTVTDMAEWPDLVSRLEKKRADIENAVIRPRIFTGYFAKTQIYVNSGIVPVAICRKPPNNWKHSEMRILAPTSEILFSYKGGKMSDSEYISRYKSDVLLKIDPEKILKELLSFGPRVAMLCYEKPFSFCHRHLAGLWLSHFLKEPICEAPVSLELKKEKTPGTNKTSQLGLF